MSKEIIISIISDLHCCHSSAKDSKSSTILFSDKLREPTIEHPIEALKKMINHEALKADYLFCPGDLSDKIDIQGLISGFNFINEIKNEFDCPLFITTGNHDIDSRRKYKEFTSAVYPTKYFTSSYPSKNTLEKQNYWADGYYIFEDANSIILNLNTSHESLNEEDAKKIQIPKPILQRIDSDLKSRDTSKVLIAQFHHHPIKMSNSKLEYRDNDVIENGDKLLEMLIDNNCDLVIHGHKHIPMLTNHNNLPIFSSGSFSSLQNVAEHSGFNTFHQIKLIPNGKSKNLKIKTWIYTMTRGWKQSADPYFWFPPNTGFGSRENVVNLIDKVERAMTKKEKMNFTDFLKEIPEIEFLTPYEQEKLETELKKKSIEFVPKLPLNPDYLTNYSKNG